MRVLDFNVILATALALTSCVAAQAQDTGEEPHVVPVSEGAARDILTTAHDGRGPFVLAAPFSYCDNTTGKIFTVPAGFVTDYASIPPRFRRFFAQSARHSPAAILHDWLYAIGEPGGKYEADRIFYYAMAEYGVAQFDRDRIWTAVYAFGESGYRLSSDWVFVDPATGYLEQPRRPKPAITPFVPSNRCDTFPEVVAQVVGHPVKVKRRLRDFRPWGLLPWWR